jgi:hypothetical protein
MEVESEAQTDLTVSSRTCGSITFSAIHRDVNLSRFPSPRPLEAC